MHNIITFAEIIYFFFSYKMKKFCETHHFFYEGLECPLCQEERSNAYSKKFKSMRVETDSKVGGNYNKDDKKYVKPLSSDDLQKFCKKFNTKNKK